MVFYPFWTWGIINLLAGIWEIYAFTERKNLILEKKTLWSKMLDGTTNVKAFWLDAWSEYTKVDSRYIKEYSPTQYVWTFELLNAILSILFIFSLFMKNLKFVKIILGLELINCIIYFTSLGIEAGTNKIISMNMQVYASKWMFVIYYLICAIWLIVPFALFVMLKNVSIM